MKRLIKNSVCLLLVVTLFSAFLGVGCQSDNNPVNPVDTDFGISAKYDSIRSYPGGGGIFVIKFLPSKVFTGKAQVRIEANSRFNAHLNKSELSSADSVFDVTISPSTSIETGIYYIKLIVTKNKSEISKILKVTVYDWGENIEDANQKFLQFKPWIDKNMSQLSTTFIEFNDTYSTYPQTLVVEHYTYISKDYEVRLCYHVMLPPDDWSMLSIRSRNNFIPDLALKRDTYGNIYPVKLTDYPVLYGY